MIRHAVIPAAGLGTRMLPAAKAVPKELLPVLDRPTIQYVVEEASAGGIDDVLLVTSRSKRAIKDHFDADPELAARLAQGGKQDLLRSIDVLTAQVRVSAVDQPRQRGLGDAVYQARDHLGSAEAFVCLLGDTIFSGDPLPAAQLVRAHRELGTTLIGLEEVPAERVGRYGIVDGEVDAASGIVRVRGLVEKPSPEQAPSRLAIAARYVLTPKIFECIERTVPGKGGEVQLTDALRLLLEDGEPIHGIILGARRHDIGNPIDWLRTNLLFAARDRAVWEQIAPLVERLLHG
jgi:UTP--glucose-1-phosphate uridylyltransferase